MGLYQIVLILLVCFILVSYFKDIELSKKQKKIKGGRIGFFIISCEKYKTKHDTFRNLPDTYIVIGRQNMEQLYKYFYIKFRKFKNELIRSLIFIRPISICSFSSEQSKCCWVKPSSN